MAALVDCAASLGECSPHQQQQLMRKQQAISGVCSSSQAVLQGLAACVHIIYENAGQQADQQAQLFASCVARSLSSGNAVQAYMVASLLKMVIRACDGNIEDVRMQDHLRTVCGYMLTTTYSLLAQVAFELGTFSKQALACKAAMPLPSTA